MKSVFISTWLSTSIKLDKLVISFLSLRWKFSFSVQIKKMGLKHLINISLIFLLKLRFDGSFLKLISIKVFYYFFRRFFFILVISYIIMMADGWNISKLKKYRLCLGKLTRHVDFYAYLLDCLVYNRKEGDEKISLTCYILQNFPISPSIGIDF